MGLYSLIFLQEILRDFDTSTEDVERLRHASKELGDVELKETYTILMRWENALNETKRRTETLERILPKLVKFEDQIRTEMEWVVKRKETLDAEVPEAPEDLPKLKKEYEVMPLIWLHLNKTFASMVWHPLSPISPVNRVRFRKDKYLLAPNHRNEGSASSIL